MATALVFVTYQDFKSRTIHVILPIVILGLSLMLNIMNDNMLIEYALHNTIFLTINILGLVVYSSIKEKSMVNPIDKTLGLGDVLLFVAITPLASLKPFILLFIGGLLFSLVSFLIFQKFFKQDEGIPLAGLFSIFLILVIGFKFIQPNNLLL